MARAGKHMGRPDSGPSGHQHVGPDDPDTAIDQDDFQDEIQGRNSLQGNDQEQVRNQRQAQPHAKRKTWGVLETFRRLDPRGRMVD